jgi:predicted sulfurtransferase
MQNDKKYNSLNIDTLLKELQSLKDKGIKEIKLNGTLLVIDNGCNTIISSTEKQF